ncbi:hypothetical protein AM571_PA00274 (plasmid) [Rhizobium etli 8C-3]|uniref:Uncharacterized protein n=1 Tax=Rhizobium etli 8C-3 TaxID=538025 RepID=A0A1L5PAD4_RHIET|nr:hypothetical protein AM571_PA00274 [Rhizobium etli 8C-3]
MLQAHPERSFLTRRLSWQWRPEWLPSFHWSRKGKDIVGNKVYSLTTRANDCPELTMDYSAM